MGLLKTIFIIVLFYYGFKVLVRLFAPFLISKAADNIQKRAQKQYQGQSGSSSVREGETIIDKTPKQNKQSKNTVGEYVDFEELD